MAFQNSPVALVKRLLKTPFLNTLYTFFYARIELIFPFEKKKHFFGGLYSDCFVTMRIIDESQPKHGIAVNFFTEKMDMLPQLATEGDIIQLSHVVVLLFYTLLNF